MPDCERCPLLFKLDPNVPDLLPDVPADQRRLATEVHEGLTASEPQCTGFRTSRYILHALRFTAGADTIAMGAAESSCVNPFRATDEFWELRKQLVRTDFDTLTRFQRTTFLLAEQDAKKRINKLQAKTREQSS